ncbi:MAG: phage tail assembly protein [Desulfotalea sp.]
MPGKEIGTEKKDSNKKIVLVVNPNIVKFDNPATVDGKEINEVELISMKGKHVINAAQDLRMSGYENPTEAEQLLSLASQATGIKMEDLEEFDAPDYLAITAKVQGFLSQKGK